MASPKSQATEPPIVSRLWLLTQYIRRYMPHTEACSYCSALTRRKLDTSFCVWSCLQYLVHALLSVIKHNLLIF